MTNRKQSTAAPNTTGPTKKRRITNNWRTKYVRYSVRQQKSTKNFKVVILLEKLK